MLKENIVKIFNVLKNSNVIIITILGLILFALFITASKCKVDMNKEQLLHQVNVAQIIAEELKLPAAIDVLNKAEDTLKSEAPEKAALEAISELIDKLILEIETSTNLINAEDAQNLANALKVLKTGLRVYILYQ